ncbi:hypothetical protein, partial [Polynucleobacter paneuropaeus]|uniref:hypothetical protein n=1 Tax=Polynucleobacter paneuropaeus TaxID=2527775 RepID=UPI0013144320
MIIKKTARQYIHIELQNDVEKLLFILSKNTELLTSFFHQHLENFSEHIRKKKIIRDKFSFKKIKPKSVLGFFVLIAFQFQYVIAQPLNALPTNGKVVAGVATISQTSTATNATMTVNQTSQRAVINWDSFNVGQNAAVNFVTPGANSSTLNRVTGASPSLIQGALSSNGQIILVNANGITFGRGAQVDAPGVVASTMDIANKDFMDGKSTFSGSGSGKIVNKGTISATTQDGFIALLAPEVQNQGYLLASKGGTVVMAAGEQITLNFQGKHLGGVNVDIATYKALVANKRVVEVNGGLVVMAAGAANQLMSSVIKNTGRVSASSVVNNGGEIEFVGNTVTQAGTVEANSTTGVGGQVNLVGNNITATSKSKTTATGATGGGQVNMGLAQTAVSGGTQVNAVTPSANTVAVNQAIVKANATQAAQNNSLAQTVTVEQGASIDASATQSGNGGIIAIWSALKTNIAGSLKAIGGAVSGNGGFVETSSKGTVILAPNAIINTSASNGKAGTWLLDPIDLTIDAATANIISAALENNNVSIAVNGNVCPSLGSCTQNGSGSLTIASGANILKATGSLSTLSLSSSGVFNLNANISGQNLNVIISSSIAYLNAGSSITANQVTVQAQTIYANGIINAQSGTTLGAAIQLLAQAIYVSGGLNTSTSSNTNTSNTTNTSVTYNGNIIRKEDLPTFLTSQNNPNGNIASGLDVVYTSSAANDSSASAQTNTNQTNIIHLNAVNDLTIYSSAQILANGTNGGQITLSAQQLNAQSGSLIQANGNNGPGGVIAISGNQFNLDGTIAANGNDGGLISINAGSGALSLTGTVQANGSNGRGGTVIATQASDIQVNSATIQANGKTDGGVITLIADTGSINFTSALIQTNGSNGRGGSVGLSANNNVTITGSTISATGFTNGGAIKIGNDASNGTLPFALSVSLDQNTALNAAQQDTSQANANGGLIETSGTTLNLLSSINAGRGGMWLLDPTSVTISATATSGSSLPSYTVSGAATTTSYVKDADIVSQINAGTSVTIIANGSITQSTNLSFAPASGVNVSLTYDTRSGTAQSITLTGTTTNTGAGNLTLNYLASGQVIVNGAINSTSTGKINVVAQSFYASNTTTSGTGSNISISSNITTKGGFIALDGTGGTISSAGVITRGAIVNGTVALVSPGSVFNTTSTGTTSVTAATTGGNLAVATSSNLTPNFGVFGSWYIGGSIDISSNPSGTAQWGFGFDSYSTAFPIAAVGNINITVNNTSSSISANKGVIDITSPVTSYGGSVNLTATTTGSVIAITTSAAISAATGVTITGTSGTAATVVNLGASTITNAAGNITITGNNSGAGGNTGISSTGAITQNANGGNISFTSNNIINQTGAITLAANTSGTASTVTYDTTSGNKAANITGGNLTIAAGSTSDINYVVKSAGSGINPGSIGSATVALPGYVLLDNTYGAASGTPVSGYITNANSGTLTGAIIGVNVNSAITANKNITLNGASQTGYYSVSMTAAITTSQGSIAITGSGINYSVYSSAAGTLTASIGSLTINGTSTTGQAVQLAGAITTQTGITINGTGTTAASIASVGALTLGAGYVAGTLSSPSIISNLAGTSGSLMGALTGSALPTISSAALSGGFVLGTPAITAAALQSSTATSATYLVAFNDGTYTKMVQVVLTASGGYVYATEAAANYSTTQLATGSANNVLGGTTNLLSLWNGSGAGGIGTVTTMAVTTSPTVNGYGVANLVLSGAGFMSNAASGNITITGNNTAAGGNAGITQSGAINDNASGGNITFTSNNSISQTGAVTVAANTSGTTSSITYDTTTGNSSSSISAGALTLTGGMAGSSSRIDYTMKSSGASIYASGAITVPGSITLDNTYLSGVDNGITVSNSNTYSTSSNYGVGIFGTLTAGAAITVQGVNSGGVSWSGQSAIQTSGNISILSSQKFAGNGITFNGLTTASNGQPLNSGNTTTFQSGTSSIVGGDVNFAMYNSGGNSAIYGGSMPITAYGANVNIGTIANHIYGGAAINGGLGAIVATKVNGVGGNVSMYGTATSSGNPAVNDSSTITADGNITVVGNSVLPNPGSTVVTLGGAITLTNVTNNSTLSITGNTPTTTGYTGANTGISVSGNIVDNSNGGNISFISNGVINQTGTTTVAANTSGTASTVTYDTTSGNKAANITGGNLTIAAGSTSDINYVVKSAGSGINPGSIGSATVALPGYVLLDNTYGAASGTPASGYITNANSGTLTGAIVGVNVNSAITANKNITLNGASQTGYYSVSMTAAITTSQGSIAITGSGINYSVYSSAAGTLTASIGSLTINGTSTTGQAVQLAGAITTQTGITINGTGTTASTIVTAGAMTLGAGYVAGTSSSPSVISNAAGTSGSVMGVLSGSTIPTISSAAISILVSGTSVAYGNPATAIALLSSTSNTATYIIGFADATYSKMVQVVLTSSSGFVYATESSAKYNTTLLSTGGAVNLLGGNTNILSLWNGSTAGGLGTATVQTLATSSTTGGYGAANLVLSGGGYISSNPSGNIIITANNTAAGGNTGISQSGAINDNASGGNISFISNNLISQAGALTLAANTSGTASTILYDTRSGNKLSTISAGAFTLTSGSTSGVNYSILAAGAALTVNTVGVNGVITVNNTYGCASAPCTALTAVDNYITTANFATLATTAANGITVNGALTGGTGVYLDGVTYSANHGVYSTVAIAATTGNIDVMGITNTGSGIWAQNSPATFTASAGNIIMNGYQFAGNAATNLNGVVTATLGSVTITGSNTTGYYAFWDNALITAATGISITGTSAPGNGNATISMSGAMTVTGVGAPITLIATNTANPGVAAIADTGAITGASGTNITFISNGIITQNGAITLAANTSGTASAVTYDTTTGNKNSTITAGALTLTGGMAGSSSRIDYTMKSSGASIYASGAITVPGSITLDNTYLSGVDNGITVSNSNTYSTSSAYGVRIDGTLTAGAAITVQGVNSGGVNWNGNAAIQTYNNISILSSQKFAGNGITFNGLTTASNGQPLNSNSTTTFQSGTSSIVGGDVNFAMYNSGGNSAIYGGSMPITAYGANVNIGTIANPIYGGAAINGGLGAIVATKVNGVGGNVSMYGTATSSGNAAVNDSSTITADGNITVVGNSVLPNPGSTVVTLGGAITLTNVTNNSTLSVTGNTAATTGYTGANTGISVTGNIVDNSNGGNISFISNGVINQTGTTTVAANTSGTVSAVTYDTTTGNKAANITGGNLTIAAGSTSDINYVVKSAGSGINPGSIGSATVALPGYVLLDNTYGAASGTPVSGYITNANSGTLTGAIIGVNVNSAITATKNITLMGASQTGYYSVSMTAAITTSQGSIAITGSGIDYSVYSSAAGTLTASIGSLTINGTSTTGQAVQLAGAITTQTGITINGTGTTASTIVTVGAMTLGTGYLAGTTANPSVISSAAGTSGSLMGILSGSVLPTISSAALSGTSVPGTIVATAAALQSSTATTATYLVAFSDGTYTKMVQLVLTSSAGYVYATEVASKYNATQLGAGTAANVLGGTTNVLSLWNGSGAGGTGTVTTQTLATSSGAVGYGVANLVLSGAGFSRNIPSGNITITANNTAAGGNTGITQSGAITGVSGTNISFISNNNISQNGAITLPANTSGTASNITYNTTGGAATTTNSKLATVTTGALSIGANS